MVDLIFYPFLVLQVVFTDEDHPATGSQGSTCCDLRYQSNLRSLYLFVWDGL